MFFLTKLSIVVAWTRQMIPDEAIFRPDKRFNHID